MITYGPFDYCEDEIRALTEYLIANARSGNLVHYDDAYKVVKNFGGYRGAHDQRLWHLLGLISESEVKDGKYPLSAMVVIKNGEGQGYPGQGFFNLERDLGRYRVDDVTTFTTEVTGLFDYWKAQ